MREENIFAKATRVRITGILTIVHTRYLHDPWVLAGLVALVREGAPDATVNPILYYLTTCDEPVLRDAVRDLLVPRRARSQLATTTSDVIRWLRMRAAAGRCGHGRGARWLARMIHGISGRLLNERSLLGGVELLS
jgi:hypothetical protein